MYIVLSLISRCREWIRSGLEAKEKRIWAFFPFVAFDWKAWLAFFTLRSSLNLLQSYSYIFWLPNIFHEFINGKRQALATDRISCTRWKLMHFSGNGHIWKYKSVFFTFHLSRSLANPEMGYEGMKNEREIKLFGLSHVSNKQER